MLLGFISNHAWVLHVVLDRKEIHRMAEVCRKLISLVWIRERLQRQRNKKSNTYKAEGLSFIEDETTCTSYRPLLCFSLDVIHEGVYWFKNLRKHSIIPLSSNWPGDVARLQQWCHQQGCNNVCVCFFCWWSSGTRFIYISRWEYPIFDLNLLYLNVIYL
jgi:hypothetical protein